MRRIQALLALVASLVVPRALYAHTANQICLGNPCVLARSVDLGPASILDFGDRVFRMTGNAKLHIQEGDTLLITARSVELQPGALIDQLSPTNSRPATVMIATTTGIQLQRSGNTKSRISLSAAQGGGTIRLTAAGNVDVDGDLAARITLGTANAGVVKVEAGGDANLRGDIQLDGPSQGLGGELDVDADGSVLVSGKTITVAGGVQGGTIDIEAGRTLTTTTTLDAAGNAASDGGDVNLVAAGDITIGGPIDVHGDGSETSGGSGGDLDIAAGGTVTIANDVQAWGRGPDAQGGTLDLAAGIDLLVGGRLFADGRGLTSFGGRAELHADRILRLGNLINVAGNEFGGEVSGEAESEIQALGEIDASGADGGSIDLNTTSVIDSVLYVRGPVTVGGNLHTGGASGGTIEIQGCDVSITASGTVSSSGSDTPGLNRLQSSRVTTITGALLAQVNGVNQIVYKSTPPQINNPTRVNPPAIKTLTPNLPECRIPTPPVCGNGVQEIGEGCDDGNTLPCDGCSAQCRKEDCANGVVDCQNQPGGEQCDDGNRADADGCDSNCTQTGCGNGIRTGTEACDDGNLDNGDGCNNLCQIEPPPGCGDGVQQVDLEEECDNGAQNGHGPVAGKPACSVFCKLEVCGNNFVDSSEDCDPGDTNACDGCSATCKTERCGNGVTECTEECDGGPNCAANCKRPGCGNGVQEAGEDCDDGNTADCDGCSPSCHVICGNGAIDAQCGEDCDAGADNGKPGVGCSPMCQMCTGQPDCPCASDLECGPNGRCGGFACEAGLCVEATVPQCDDGDNCNGTELCDDGTCVPGTARVCDDGNACNGAETCVANNCVAGTTPDCDDGDECTDGSCSAGGCVQVIRPGGAGIECEARAMTSALATAAAEDVAPGVRKKLTKLLNAISKKAGQAAGATGKKQRKLMKAVGKQLVQLDAILKKARKKHQLGTDLDSALTASRQSAGRALETFNTSGRS